VDGAEGRADHGQEGLVLPGVKTLMLGCASFFAAFRISLKCLWKASSMKASDGAWA
jgi:hypothetical protein